MNKLLRIGLTGLLISFLGSLPLGTLNITAFQIAVFQDVGNALWFALAVVLVELLVVRITLKWSGTIDLRNRIFFYTLPLAALILLYLSVASFMTIGEERELGTSLNLIPMIKSSFVLGLLLSILNPMHFPFWISWNSILTAKKTLSVKKDLYDILSKHSGQKYAQIEKDSDRDYWMTSEEAVEYGMIDEILFRNKV